MSLTIGLHRAMLVNARGTAVAFEGRKRSWAELGARVARLAGALKGLGVAKGDRVALLMLNSDRYFELYLAVAWAGAVIVPLNIRWSALENEDALRDCGARVMFVDKAFAAVGQTLGQTIGGLSLVYADDGEAPAGMAEYEALLSAAEPAPDARAARSDLAGIFYTGGTTGRSKGVMLSHDNLLHNGWHALAEGLFRSNTIYLHAAPMFHLADGAATFSLLSSGGSNVIIRAFSPEAVFDAIETHRVTEVLLVPTMIQMVVDHPDISRRDLSSLKRLVYGASPITEALLDRAAARLPGVEFTQAYGMTELSPIATLLPHEDHFGEGRAKGRHRSAGRPTFGVEVRIVDADDKPVPYGTVGEVAVRGPNVMMGYWNRPEETAKAVIDGWMHTGDGAYMDEDGYVYVVDRVKDMIISGGENVYSAEVENVVAQHPAVAQCAVIGIPSKEWGEQVHAVVVAKPDVKVTAEEIIAFCKQRIAGYKCPRSVDLRQDPLPLSGAGKILKRELRKPYWEGQTRSVA